MQRSLPNHLPLHGLEESAGHDTHQAHEHAHEHDHTRDRRWLDRIGAALGFACAVHCMVVPLLVGVLPALGLGFIADHTFDLTIVVIASVFAVFAARSGWRANGDRRVLGAFAAAVAMLFLGLALGEESLAGRIPSIAGGVLLALAHLANLRANSARSHAH
jgi:hypothetical protein